jgi:hypothetical protein
MIESLVEQVRAHVEAARPLYHRLVMIVGRPGGGKTTVLLHLAERHGWPYLNVNLELTGRLLELTRRQRALRTPQILADIVNAAGTEVVLLDNIEALFSVALQQDPLRLLQGLSRQRTIVAAWPGRLVGRRLMYAEPGHPEARSYENAEAVLFPIDSPDAVSAVADGQDRGGDR